MQLFVFEANPPTNLDDEVPAAGDSETEEQHADEFYTDSESEASDTESVASSSTSSSSPSHGGDRTTRRNRDNRDNRENQGDEDEENEDGASDADGYNDELGGFDIDDGPSNPDNEDDSNERARKRTRHLSRLRRDVSSGVTGRDRVPGGSGSGSDSDGSGTDSESGRRDRRRIGGGGGDSDTEGNRDRRRREKRSRTTMDIRQSVQGQLRRICRRYRAYYASQRFSTPASYLALRLILSLNKRRNDYLWLSLVGITSALLEEKLARDEYEVLYEEVMDFATLTNPAQYSREHPETGLTVTSVIPREGWIARSGEPLFVLYRHWSLEKSMRACSYISTRLDTWQGGHGVTALDRLIASTGVSQKYVSKPYSAVPQDVRTRFFRELEKIIEDPVWGLRKEDLFYPSAITKLTHSAIVSAADVVYSLQGLLSNADDPSTAATVLSSLPNSVAAVSNDPLYLELRKEQERRRQGWKACFHRAFESLHSPCSDLMEHGIILYKQLRDSILRVTPVLVRSGQAYNGLYFRWIELGPGFSDSERKLFANAVPMEALGKFLIYVYRDSLFKWRRQGVVSNKPLILTLPLGPVGGSSGSGSGDTSVGSAATAGAKSSWIFVLGLPVQEHGQVVETSFLDAFENAAIESRALYILDSFDSCSMVIEEGSLYSFLRQLDPNITQ